MRPPNILIFMTDQQRGDSVLADHPCPLPHAGGLARSGVTFSRTYCPSPHCCPSRASFFTGLMPTEHGVWNNVSTQNALTRGLKPGTRLWSEDLAKAGYSLEYSGKWHVSDESNPSDHGWHEGFFTAGKGSFMDRSWESYLDGSPSPEHRSDERPEAFIPRDGYPDYHHYGPRDLHQHDEKTVESARESLSKQVRGRDPWVNYCGVIGPHDPYFPPNRYLDRVRNLSVTLPASFEDDMSDKPGLYRRVRQVFGKLTPREHAEAIRHYWAYCLYVDDLFGSLLKILDESGQAENTLVLFTSDHGDYAGEHGLWCKGLPCFHGAYHIPAVVRYPAGGAVGGTVSSPFASLLDFGPTFLDAAGVNVDRAMTGLSLMPFLKGGTPERWRDAVFTQSNGNELYGIQRSIRTESWHFTYNGFDLDELYDLQKDPNQMVNLMPGGKHEAVARDLMARIWRFGADRGETCINPYIMVGLAKTGPASARGRNPEI